MVQRKALGRGLEALIPGMSEGGPESLRDCCWLLLMKYSPIRFSRGGPLTRKKLKNWPIPYGKTASFSPCWLKKGLTVLSL